MTAPGRASPVDSDSECEHAVENEIRNKVKHTQTSNAKDHFSLTNDSSSKRKHMIQCSTLRTNLDILPGQLEVAEV